MANNKHADRYIHHFNENVCGILYKYLLETEYIFRKYFNEKILFTTFEFNFHDDVSGFC